MVAGFQCPLPFEGFDSITFENKFNPTSEDIDNLKELMDNFNQDNPHHKHTLGKHCQILASFYNKDDKEELPKYMAGLYHDVGKLFTKKFDSEGIAHYYNHDNIGTYYLITHPTLLDKLEEKDRLEALFLINYHMRGYKDFLFPKAESKYRKKFGDRLFESLILFAENDKKASQKDS